MFTVLQNCPVVLKIICWLEIGILLKDVSVFAVFFSLTVCFNGIWLAQCRVI